MDNKKKDLDKLRNKMIAEIQDYAIILLDREGNVLSWNKGAEKIKGYKEEDIIGRNFKMFYTLQDKDAALPEKLLEQAKREGRASHTGRRVRKDGSIFWGIILITALHDETGEVIGYTKLSREIVDPKLINS